MYLDFSNEDVGRKLLRNISPYLLRTKLHRVYHTTEIRNFITGTHCQAKAKPQ